MIERDEAKRAREALGEVLSQIDADEVEASRSERASIAGAISALDALDGGPGERSTPT